MKNMNINELKCTHENIDLDKYLEFYYFIKDNMEHPEWLGDFTKEDFKYLLLNNSKIWIYYINDIIVCSMMFIPSDLKALNKLEIELDYNIVAEYGPIMVSPKYLGNKLQYQMLKILDKYTIDKGYKYVVSTIHPDNIYSINNFIKDDFKLINQKEFKRGIRNIYMKRLYD